MYKKYFVYVDDGDEVMKIAVPAESKQDARNFVDGTGEVVTIKEVTREYSISAYKVSEALGNAGFSRTDRDFIVRALMRVGIADRC